MIRITTLVLILLLTGCNSTSTFRFATSDSQFDYMPDPLTWDRNIRDCRSEPQCNAADLFNRF